MDARLRPVLPRDSALTTAVLRVVLRAISALLEKRCPDAPAHAQLGAVSLPHRFGSTLNAHFHFHLAWPPRLRLRLQARTCRAAEDGCGEKIGDR
jgi:hypothetical protein